MAHHHHTFTKKLKPKPSQAKGRLPANHFGGLVGTIDHLTLSPHDGKKPDNNHVYIWINVPAGPNAGRYECAFNTESTDTSPTLYAVVEEEIDPTEIPTYGFEDASVSYAAMGLTEADFQVIQNGTLRSSVFNWAQHCDEIVAYGLTYNDGTGIHDIHMNSGERPGSGHANRVNQDGALAFYYRPPAAAPYRRWAFIKFSTQDLPA
jgi:hypothetical protein